jgi:acetyl esterase/lipase
MKKIAALLLILSIWTFVSARDMQTDIEYGRAGDKALLLDAGMPRGDGPYAAVIIVHGGGWNSGDKQDVELLFRPLNDVNLVWFSINYRLAPKSHWPACLEDVQTAVRYVRANAAKFKVDPDRIALMGYSAGGQIACLAAAEADKNAAVQAVVGLAPPTDLVLDTLRRGGLSDYLKDLFGRETLDEQMLQILWESSPINHTGSGLPPFLLVHGTADKSVPYQQSLNFKARLEAVGVQCDIITIQNAPHRITEWSSFDGGWTKKMTDWLVQTLNKE